MLHRTDSFGCWLRRRRALDSPEVLAPGCCSHFSIRKIEADKRPSRGLADRLAKSLAIPEDERRAFLDAARAVQSQLLSLTNFCIPPPPLPSNSAGSVLSLAAIGKGAPGFQKQEAALPLSSGRQAGKDGRLSPSP